MDILTILGVVGGLAAILIGQMLEGGHAGSLLNLPAILIVFGGSLGAIMVQAPMSTFANALKLSVWTVIPPKLAADQVIEKIINWSNIARKEGLLGLEDSIETEPDTFSKKALQLLVDGNEPETIRSILEVEIDAKEKKDLNAAKLYESMGGYTPTIGIIGAVMGLIHVMENLDDPSMLGTGIAVAFVATIYGVGLANMLLIPMSAKLKMHIESISQFREMLVEGVVSIAEGENPRNIEIKLQGYLS